MQSEFTAPVPGQSLTTPPGQHPYERPPEINDPEEAIQMHLDRLSKPDKVQDIVDILEMDNMDVVTLTEGILRSAVAEGIHSIDVSLTVAPVIHEFIRLAADRAGIEYDEGLVNEKEEKKRTEIISKAKAKKKARKYMEEVDLEEEAPVEEAPVEEEEESGGFMERMV